MKHDLNLVNFTIYHRYAFLYNSKLILSIPHNQISAFITIFLTNFLWVTGMLRSIPCLRHVWNEWGGEKSFKSTLKINLRTFNRYRLFRFNN